MKSRLGDWHQSSHHRDRARPTSVKWRQAGDKHVELLQDVAPGGRSSDGAAVPWAGSGIRCPGSASLLGRARLVGIRDGCRRRGEWGDRHNMGSLHDSWGSHLHGRDHPAAPVRPRGTRAGDSPTLDLGPGVHHNSRRCHVASANPQRGSAGRRGRSRITGTALWAQLTSEASFMSAARWDSHPACAEGAPPCRRRRSASA